MPLRPMITLRCTMQVDGETFYAQVPVDREAWQDADKVTRDRFREAARRALGEAIIDRRQPLVTVVEPEPTLAEAVEKALAEYDAQQDHFYDAPKKD